MKQIRPRQNSLGPAGWVSAGKYKLERRLYILHRVAGLCLLLAWAAYLVRVTILQFQGQDTWAATLTLVHGRWFGIVAVLFVYHSLNGLRLGLQELGFTLGRPALPVYPFQDSLRKKRPVTIAMVTVSAVLSLTLLYVFFVVGVR